MSQPLVSNPPGLSAAQVQERIRSGRVNTLPPRSGKTVGQIIRTNVFTRINAILGVLLAMVLTTGSWINTAFGLLIVVNSAIGIIQELRAKHTLDSLSVIGEEHPTVVRDGVARELAQSEIVMDDVIALSAGRQIVVDGEVIAADYLTVDESQLTGESDPVQKKPGDQVLSGSFVVVGTGYYRVTAVGSDSYAAQLTAAARKFTLQKSQLQEGIDKILKVIVWVLVPVAVAITIAQFVQGAPTYRDLILAITGALVPMVPEGLVLITSTAFALGVIRLGKRKCLVQELPAIEGLARVDVVCADKTGTLTENTLEYSKIVPLGGAGEEECANALAQVVYADSDPNATSLAIQAALARPAQAWKVTGKTPFSSARKWASVTFSAEGAGSAGEGAGEDARQYFFGAPDMLATAGSEAASKAQELGAQGLRVLMLARAGERGLRAASSQPTGAQGAQLPEGAELPEDLSPIALVVLEQTVRPDAADTIDFFHHQDVEIKVISGDNPESVAAVTSRIGVSDANALDARGLDDMSEEEFTKAVAEHSVFGRVRPDQKQKMVSALQSKGHTVAMTGDGVNDVLALKNADIGVAMGAGTSAARAVAKIVLLDNRFATLPYVVAEGRRVIGNIERVASLFLTKTTYSALLAVLIIASSVPFPFQPIHVTITGWFTIGLPAFILSLPPNNARARAGFVRRVLGFSIPAGVVVGVSSFITYLAASGWHVPEEHTQQSTAALLALIIPSVWVLACVARPWNAWKIALFLVPLAGYWLIFTLPITQRGFLLDSSNSSMMWLASGIGLAGAVVIELIWHAVGKRLSAHLR